MLRGTTIEKGSNGLPVSSAMVALPARNRQQTTREHRKLVTVRGTPAGRDARSQIVLQNAFVCWRGRQTAYQRLIDFHPRAALNNESQCKLVQLVVG